MASIGNEKNGTRRILFFDVDGARRTVRLGKISKRDAESFKWRIERLIESKRLNTALDLDMASWLDGLDGQLRDRLVKVGLMCIS